MTISSLLTILVGCCVMGGVDAFYVLFKSNVCCRRGCLGHCLPSPLLFDILIFSSVSLVSFVVWFVLRFSCLSVYMISLQQVYVVSLSRWVVSCAVEVGFRF